MGRAGNVVVIQPEFRRKAVVYRLELVVRGAGEQLLRLSLVELREVKPGKAVHLGWSQQKLDLRLHLATRAHPRVLHRAIFAVGVHALLRELREAPERRIVSVYVDRPWFSPLLK